MRVGSRAGRGGLDRRGRERGVVRDGGARRDYVEQMAMRGAGA